MIKIIALEYFKAFSRKDINALRELLSPNVSLRDWEINAKGLDAVIAANSKIFSSVESITVSPVNVFLDGAATVIAELDIEVNHSNPIKVVDILEFNNSGKICAIRAFKG